MKANQTKEKIIQTAIQLFNEKGVSNVTLRMIGAEAKISSGNITYHYKAKQDLIRAVYLKMRETFAQIPLLDHLLFEGGKGLELIKQGFGYVIDFRFFFQDPMEILRLDPGIQQLHQEETDRMHTLITNTNFIAVGKGVLIPEPWDGYYAYLAKNIWMCMQFWIQNQTLQGKPIDDINEGLRTVGALIYPHYTEKGREMYNRVIEELTGEQG